MNIEKIETGFSTFIDIGKYSNIIFLKNDGAFISVDDAFEKCQHFSNIIIKGDDPLEQRDDIIKLCKKLIKNNEKICIEIHTKGFGKPIDSVSISSNIVYYIYMDLNNLINEKDIVWYGHMRARFIFNVKNEDDIDKIIILTKGNVSKSQCFLHPIDGAELIKNIKASGFNIMFEVDFYNNA